MKLGGYLIGYALKKKSGVYIEKFFNEPIHNTITKHMLNNMLEWNGPGSVFNGNTGSYSNYRGNLWVRKGGNRYGVLEYAALGSGTGQTSTEDLDLKNRVTEFTSTKKTGVNWCGTYFFDTPNRIMNLRISHQHDISQNFSIKEIGLFHRIYPDGSYSLSARVELEEPVDVESGDIFYSIYEIRITPNERKIYNDFFGLGPCVSEGCFFANGQNVHGYSSVSFESIDTSGTGHDNISSSSSMDGRMFFMEPIYNLNIGSIIEYKLKAFKDYGKVDINYCGYFGGYFANDQKQAVTSSFSNFDLKNYIQDSFYRELSFRLNRNFMGSVPCYALFVNGTMYRFGHYEGDTFVANPLTTNEEMEITFRQSFSTDLLTPAI